MWGFGGRNYWGRRERRKRRGIVVLFTWISIEENHLKDFVDLYASLGWDSLVCDSQFLNFFFPDKAMMLAWDVLSELVELTSRSLHPPANILLAAFPSTTSTGSSMAATAPKWAQKTVSLLPHPRGCHLLTSKEIGTELSDFKCGLTHLFIQHTSASLTMNENCDPAVRADLETFLNIVVPEGHSAPWKHTDEGYLYTSMCLLVISCNGTYYIPNIEYLLKPCGRRIEERWRCFSPTTPILCSLLSLFQWPTTISLEGLSSRLLVEKVNKLVLFNSQM